jgi:hypothetical protein
MRRHQSLNMGPQYSMAGFILSKAKPAGFRHCRLHLLAGREAGKHRRLADYCFRREDQERPGILPLPDHPLLSGRGRGSFSLS